MRPRRWKEGKKEGRKEGKRKEPDERCGRERAACQTHPHAAKRGRSQHNVSQLVMQDSLLPETEGANSEEVVNDSSHTMPNRKEHKGEPRRKAQLGVMRLVPRGWCQLAKGPS